MFDIAVLHRILYDESMKSIRSHLRGSWGQGASPHSSVEVRALVQNKEFHMNSRCLMRVSLRRADRAEGGYVRIRRRFAENRGNLWKARRNLRGDPQPMPR